MTVIPTTLAATLLIQVGYFLWKVSAEGQPRIGQASAVDVARSLLTDWRWMLGFAATTAGWVLFVQATSLGDISLVQPLMSAGDLLLILLAVVFLKERLVAIEWLGVLATVLGAMALAWDAETAPSTRFGAVRLGALLGITLLAGLAIWWAGRRRPRPEIYLAMIVGLCFGAGSVLTKAMTIHAAEPGQLGIGWAILVDPLLPAVILANVMGLVLLQAAFQRGRAAVVVPLQLALANALTVVCGVWVFAEQIDVLRAFGIVLIVGGTAILHLKPEPVV
jgi:uncharacterized membrane protein